MFKPKFILVLEYSCPTCYSGFLYFCVQMSKDAEGIASLLGTLMPSGEESLEQRVDTLTEVNGQVLNLPLVADAELMATNSK